MASGSPSVAVVIGSGSVKCAASLGMLRVLERADIGVDLVVGCSGGSLYAAGIALGWSAEEALAATRRMWTREVTRKRRTKSLLSVIMPGWFGFDEEFGLLDDSLILERLRSVFGSQRIEDTRIPLRISATDFRTGEAVVIASGSLVDAVRASIAMPYLLSPWKFDGRLLTDGYLSDPLPVGPAIHANAQIILAMGFEANYQTRINSLPRFSFQVSSIMTNNLLKANFAFHNLAHHSEVVPVLPEFRQRIGLFDTQKIGDIVEDGERAMEAQMPYLQRLLAAG